ncbi:MAG: FlgD immunoglobulin-like domain containing protein [Candidatus Kryptoniota bacterium]
MRVLSIILITSFFATQGVAQLSRRAFNLEFPSPRPSSNSISQIVISNNVVYLGTEKGLNLTADGGRTFKTDFGTNGPTGTGISAIAVKGDTIAVAASTTFEQSGTSYPKGAGLFVSTDKGISWTFKPQSTDSLSDSTVTYGSNRLKALPITTQVNNVTYSLAFYKGYLYAADFAGGLRRTADLGKTWQRVVLPPDYLNYINPDSVYNFQLSPVAGSITYESNLNHRVFSLYSDGDSALYVGTADGINKTTDSGLTWQKFNHQNQSNPISGNFVVSISGNDFNGAHFIWAATVNANDPSEQEGISYTMDGGLSWQYVLTGHFFHSMAFNRKILYAASDDGLYRSGDLGRTYQVITTILDPITRQSVLTDTYYAVAAENDTVWIGTSDGTAIGIDNGAGFDFSSWRVARAYQPITATSQTYFYPNPFSPKLDIGRIHYTVTETSGTVTIRIYDFSMHVVRTIIQNASRPNGDQDEIWNGLDQSGRVVDNGVYFYSVQINSGKLIWGKILVVR